MINHNDKKGTYIKKLLTMPKLILPMPTIKIELIKKDVAIDLFVLNLFFKILFVRRVIRKVIIEAPIIAPKR